MAINILFGPGGSGKSFYQVRLIVDELLNGERNIVTNLALDVPALAAYIEEKYPQSKVEVGKRVRILTTEETLSFYKHRGPYRFRGATGSEYDMEEDRGERGVLFVIDEAGAAGFSAQGWAQSTGRSTRGEECSWYLDQQRKFSDNVVASTNGRTPNQIAKCFRDKAHAFVKLHNGYLQQWGIFRGRPRFTARWFTEEPGPRNEPFRVEHWQLDCKGLAGCYRTQDGVGVSGKNADIGARAKGISITWLVPAFMLLAVMCVLIPWGLGKGASWMIQDSRKNASKGDVLAKKQDGPTAPPPDGLSQQKRQETGPQQAAGNATNQPVNPLPQPPKVTGFAVTAGRINILMSDGRVITERDPEFEGMRRNAVILEGKTHVINGTGNR